MTPRWPMKTWTILRNSTWPARKKALRRMAFIFVGSMAPFLLALFFFGFLGLDIVLSDFIVHGEAAIAAISAMVAATFLITRTRKDDDASENEDDAAGNSSPEFPNKALFIWTIVGLWVFSSLAYAAALVAPKFSPPRDIAGNVIFLAGSIMLWVVAILISGVVEVIDAVLSADVVRSMIQRQYQDFTDDFRETVT